MVLKPKSLPLCTFACLPSARPTSVLLWLHTGEVHTHAFPSPQQHPQWVAQETFLSSPLTVASIILAGVKIRSFTRTHVAHGVSSSMVTPDALPSTLHPAPCTLHPASASLIHAACCTSSLPPSLLLHLRLRRRQQDFRWSVSLLH